MKTPFAQVSKELRERRENRQGHFRTDNHAVVTFETRGITDLELADFSDQNVLFGLDVSRDEGLVRITLSPSFGLGGRIVAREVKVSFSPGKPRREDRR